MAQEKSEKAVTRKKGIVVDSQTKKAYEMKDETPIDHFFAILSVIYLLLMMAFFLWQMFDIWIGQYSLAIILGYPTKSLGGATFRLVIFAFIGGALGGIVNGIRSLLSWHADRYAFGARFTWNYITAPWIGAALALFTHSIVRSGVAIFGGTGATDTSSLGQVLAVFSIGVLSGYGSRAVFVWLDDKVASLFKVPPPKVLVPKLTELSLEDAEKELNNAHLKLGETVEVNPDNPAQEGKVISQVPEPGVRVDKGSAVNLNVGRTLILPANPIEPAPTGGNPNEG